MLSVLSAPLPPSASFPVWVRLWVKPHSVGKDRRISGSGRRSPGKRIIVFYSKHLKICAAVNKETSGISQCVSAALLKFRNRTILSIKIRLPDTFVKPGAKHFQAE